MVLKEGVLQNFLEKLCVKCRELNKTLSDTMENEDEAKINLYRRRARVKCISRRRRGYFLRQYIYE